MAKHKAIINTFIISLAIIYTLILISVAFIFPVRERTSKTYEYSFIPLKNTLHQIHDPAQYSTPGYWLMFFISIAGNFLLFIPFGFLSCLLFPKKTKRIIFFYAVTTSVLIELTQLIFHLGVCDIDDVILNGLGAFAGILIFNLLFKKLSSAN